MVNSTDQFVWPLVYFAHRAICDFVLQRRKWLQLMNSGRGHILVLQGFSLRPDTPWIHIGVRLELQIVQACRIHHHLLACHGSVHFVIAAVGRWLGLEKSLPARAKSTSIDWILTRLLNANIVLVFLDNTWLAHGIFNHGDLSLDIVNDWACVVYRLFHPWVNFLNMEFIWTIVLIGELLTVARFHNELDWFVMLSQCLTFVLLVADHQISLDVWWNQKIFLNCWVSV